MNRILLIILDGYGINPSAEGNAITAAVTPNLDQFFSENGYSLLSCSGLDVGLPEGAMGNSEVGHLNIGAGRIVYQLNTMIDRKIRSGEFFSRPCFREALDHTAEYNSNIHLMGLVSDGNVHSHLEHLYALLELFKSEKRTNVYLHAFTDGRDTLPHSGLDFIEQVEDRMKQLGTGRIASVCGRYYAMDRDQRWERIEKAYRAVVESKGENFGSAAEAIRSNYKREITDEFIVPAVIREKGHLAATVEENDCIIFFNFRADRARQLSRAFLSPGFNHFRVRKFLNLKYITFSEYDADFNSRASVCFRLPELTNILGQFLSDRGMTQLRLAETEKYAHVTFFFNGGKEEPFPGETRILVPSPRISTYDLKPEMSAFQVKVELVKALQKKEHDLIVTNFANSDMVGHTGNFDAAVKAVEAVDQCLGEIIPAAARNGYILLLTADHGNADKMVDNEDNIFTAHSNNPVPFSIASPTGRKYGLKNGILADIAPTLLDLMGLKKPAEMTGRILY